MINLNHGVYIHNVPLKNLKKKYFGSLVSPRFMLHKVDPSPTIEKHVILVATPKKMPKSVSMDSIDDVSQSQMPCFFYTMNVCMYICMYVWMYVGR